MEERTIFKCLRVLSDFVSLSDTELLNCDGKAPERDRVEPSYLSLRTSC